MGFQHEHVSLCARSPDPNYLSNLSLCKPFLTASFSRNNGYKNKGGKIQTRSISELTAFQQRPFHGFDNAPLLHEMLC